MYHDDPDLQKFSDRAGANVFALGPVVEGIVIVAARKTSISTWTRKRARIRMRIAVGELGSWGSG